MIRLSMKINAKVIPNAKHNRIQKDEDGLRIYITQPAVDGKANKAIIPFLAKHFGIKKSQVSIIKGIKSRYKLIQVENK